jgi:CubicO group peptidase (beta-lactamase class C family)
LNNTLPERALDEARDAAAAAPAWRDAIAFAMAHETPWPRDPDAAPGPGQQPFGVHHDDPPPWNRLLGPLHARGGPSGVIWVDGREVAAWGEPERADLTFSVAKTYLALLAGVAVQRGLIADLDEPVVQRWPGIGFDSPHNRGVRWIHLLQQTSEWEGACFGLSEQADRWRKVANDPRPAGGPKGGARPLQAPGSHWEYNDVRINQLAFALAHVFGRPLPEVFDEALLGPLGARSAWAWRGYDEAWFELGGRRVQSVPGGTHWGGGVSIGARDQARVGQLLLDGGLHQGQRLLAADWVQRLREPCAVAPFYGLLVWLNRDRRAFPAAGDDAFLMLGAGGHVVWIEPRHRAVVVARWLDPAHTHGFMQAVATGLAAADAPGGDE